MTEYEYTFQDPEKPIEERIDSILSFMNLDEKVECLGTNPSVPRLGIKGSGHIEGLHGVAMGEPGGWGGKAPLPTTTFCQSIGLGQTWDPDLIQRAAAVEGYEARFLFQSEDFKRGGIVIRSPNADLGRDPRWGRTEECYGEDPYFNGTMTAAFVRGLQGPDPKYWMSASLMKHFLANSNEDGRDNSSSDFDERLFREYYSVPFRMGVEAGSRAYMAAYNACHGIPCAVHPMLKEITVNEWGQDGIICTDGGAMKMLVTAHKAFPDFPHACAAVIQAGIGQFLDDHIEPTKTALEQGLVTEDEIDLALRGNFRVMIRLGLLDPPERVPYAAIGAPGTEEPWQTEAHKAVAAETARKSIVLLKNDHSLLPLNRHQLSSIAVVGPFADQVYLDWYSGSPPYAITPLQGIQDKAAPDTTVTFHDGADLDAAVDAARRSDAVVVFVGHNPVGANDWAKVNTPDEGREAVDRQSLHLPDGQEQLIRRVQEVNPKTIVVLVSSFPYAITWAQEHVSAILQSVHNCQEAGTALADVLFGDYNPAGRLVQTWPRSLEDLPPMMDYNIRNGRTYLYSQKTPLYPFGHGLSYTDFHYSSLKTSADRVSGSENLSVAVDVTNTGLRDGEEVVQMYVKHLDSHVERPLQELKGFQRVALAAGETKTVTLPLKAADLAFWDVKEHRFVVENGPVEILIGTSSANILLRKTIRCQS